MGSRKLVVFHTLFNFLNVSSVNEFFHQILLSFFNVYFFSVSTYLPPLFGFIDLFRFKRNDSYLKYNSKSNFSEIYIEENINSDSNYVEPEPVSAIDFKSSENDQFSKKETTEFCFNFKFPTYEEMSRSKIEKGDFIRSEATPCTRKSFCSFIEELEAKSFKVEEVHKYSNDDSFGYQENGDEEECFSDKDSKSVPSEAEAIYEETYENPINGVIGEELTGTLDAMTFTGEKSKTIDSKSNLDVSEENKSSSVDSDSESDNLNHLHSVMSRLVDSYSDGFLSGENFGESFELDDLMDINGQEAESYAEMLDLDEFEDSTEEEDSDIMEELRNLEEAHMQDINFLSDKDFPAELDTSKHGESSDKNDKTIKSSEISDSKNSQVLDSEDTNEVESMWEHRDFIEQLKMEIKKVRIKGLPTILEESEAPKIMEDLKPWKMDKKLQHENPMSELHKFYKSYRERMRKFDILNYQKMYAIGFLRLKDPLQSVSSTQKTSIPDVTFILSKRLYRIKKHESDPKMKFLKELQSDLEVVYVGQMCLSWEILRWQYGMALELWESDPRRMFRYNEVAGEFQQFQVLLQRFVEDEPFQGPRVQNYVKSRYALLNLLQVPLVREDSSKEKGKARSVGDEYAITSDMLVEILEESIRVIWRFVRADKDCSSATMKSRKATLMELEDPADSELLKEVRNILQKKERKLKEQMRGESCILRKFHKCHEDESDPVLYFFSQVDMKLVSRVLNMSKKTRDQLVWCLNKLSRISFINRTIHVEPSFSLFPC